MERTVKSGGKYGTVTAPASKSQLHRLVICAALSGEKCEIICDRVSDDVSATIRCLRNMGTVISAGESISVYPASSIPKTAALDCGESGSTLRFLIPIAAALGIDADFKTAGRLSERPVTPLLNELKSHGVVCEKSDGHIKISGRLQNGDFTIPGDISSQFVSGLLFALPLSDGDSTLTVTGRTESGGYISMTEEMLRKSGIEFEKCGNVYGIKGNQRYNLTEKLIPEGDFSGAAPFLCMGAFSEKGITVNNLNRSSCQGDSRIVSILRDFGAQVSVNSNGVTVRAGKLRGITIDASDIPDLVPCLCALACGAEGKTVITGASRLRLKESDRIETACSMLKALGAEIAETRDGFEINGTGKLVGGVTDSFGDHRIAMAAAVAACICIEDAVICGSECVSKSYPGFWEDFDSLEMEK